MNALQKFKHACLEAKNPYNQIFATYTHFDRV